MPETIRPAPNYLVSLSCVRPRLLYVTNFGYPARGRDYPTEDIMLTGRLRDEFDLAVCHPLDTTALMDSFDAVVVRNSGPVLGYQAAYDEFRRRAVDRPVYNPLTGKADMAGKQYLIDLSRAGYPVIPTIDARGDVDRLPAGTAYIVKPKWGSDSIGLVVTDDLADVAFDNVLVQPLIDFEYEVSFYYVDGEYQYALYTPDKTQRWELAPYQPSDEDLAFAQRFVDWNALPHGIERVDACRTKDGELLLVELEDLNPFLSLDRVEPDTRDRFVAAFAAALHRLVS